MFKNFLKKSRYMGFNLKKNEIFIYFAVKYRPIILFYLNALMISFFIFKTQ